MIADEHLLVTFNKHYNISSFVSQVEAHGIQIMVSMTKMDCSGPFVPFVLMFIWDNNKLFVLFLQLTIAIELNCG